MMRRIFFPVLLLLFASIVPVSAQTVTPTPGLDVFCGTPAPTWTPAPSSTPAPTYSDLVLSLSPIAYWKLDDTSGSVATDHSGNGFHGSYSGVTLAGDTSLNGDAAPSFDGVNDFVNVYSSGLAGAFNGSEGTVIASGTVVDWADAQTRRLVNFESNVQNIITLTKEASSGLFGYIHRADNVTKSIQRVGSPSGWVVYAQTWSATNDQQLAYANGSQVGATQTGLGAWVSALNSSTTAIGIRNVSSLANPWHGAIAHVAVFDYALSPAQVASISTMPGAPPPTPTPVFTPTPYPECVVLGPEYVWTVVPPNGTPGVGQEVRFSYAMTAGDAGVAILLGTLLITLWVTYLLIRRKTNSSAKSPPRKS